MKLEMAPLEPLRGGALNQLEAEGEARIRSSMEEKMDGVNEDLWYEQQSKRATGISKGTRRCGNCGCPGHMEWTGQKGTSSRRRTCPWPAFKVGASKRKRHMEVLKAQASGELGVEAADVTPAQLAAWLSENGAAVGTELTKDSDGNDDFQGLCRRVML